MDKNINEELVADLAVKALLYEVSISPKLGLVSRTSNGSHRDMNFYTFIDSAISLRNYFLKSFKYGKENNLDDSFFKNLRNLGKKAEEKMFLATKNINTHKGTIFSMGILLSALSYELKINKIIILENLVKTIKKISLSLENELEKNLKDNNLVKSAGEKIFEKYGIKGARGLALAGYDLVLLDGLKKLKKYSDILDFESSCILVLIYYVSMLDDTNIINRTDIETLKSVKLKAKEVFDKNNFKMNKTELRKDTENLNKYFIEKNISPGGSADLLILTIFMYFLLKEKILVVK